MSPGNPGKTAMQPSQSIVYPRLPGLAVRGTWKIAGGVLMVVLTAVMAGANVIYAILGYYQLSTMNGQLDRMETDSLLDSRAWVGCSTIGHKAIVQGQRIEVEVVFTNSGKTPAVDMTFCGSICIREPGYDIITHAASKEKTTGWLNPTGKGPLAPNSSILLPFSSSKDLEVSKPLAEQIKSGNLVVYVFGRIIYRDIFEREHRTWFCYTADPATNLMYAYNQYNGMN